MFGSYYVIDHVIAEYRRRADEENYRVYVGDLLKILAEGWGATVYYRYSDLIHPSTDEKTGDDIALEVIEKIGLKVRNGN